VKPKFILFNIPKIYREEKGRTTFLKAIR